MSNRNTMGVLIISPFFQPNIGGVENTLNLLVYYLSRKGYKVFVSTYKPLTTKVADVPSVESGRNFKIYRCNWPGRGLFHILESNFLLEFLYLAPGLLLTSLGVMARHRREVQVIHAHGLVASFVAKICSKIFRRRALMCIHAIYNFEGRPLFRGVVKWNLASFDRVFALADVSRRNIISVGLTPSNVQVYGTPIDYWFFVPKGKKGARTQLGLGESFVVLFVGRLIEKKGLRVLLEASKAIERGTLFIIVGDGPFASEISKRASSQGNLLFVGKVPHEMLPTYYSAADVVAVPSQYEEGYSRVVLEAMSCGTPVIAANKGCLPDIVNQYVGMVVNPTAENVVQAIEHLRDNPKILSDLSQACRNYVLQRYSPEVAFRIFEESYAQQ